MVTSEIESRLAALEAEVAALKQSRHPAVPALRPIDLLDRIHNTFKDDEAFQEAMRLGRKWRESQRPKAIRKQRTKRK